MLANLEFDPVTLAYESLHRGGADFSEIELNRLARAVIAQDAEIRALRREMEQRFSLAEIPEVDLTRTVAATTKETDRQRLDFAIGQAANTIKENTAQQIADWLDTKTDEVGHAGEMFLSHWADQIRRGSWR